ncbi:recombinase family protein, partial [Streptomyces avermitilis]|uniref:recombinase family protein n=1 Tax=Streptomyces avermitilis TaxID=33903 RepID=UPI0033A2845A
AANGVSRVFSEKISTRATQRPELEKAVTLARLLRASGVRLTLVVHEHKRLGRGIELATLAEDLKAGDVGLEFLTGELKGSHDPSGVVFTVLAALSGWNASTSATAPSKATSRPVGGASRSAGPASPTTGCCPWPCTCASRR